MPHAGHAQLRRVLGRCVVPPALQRLHALAKRLTVSILVQAQPVLLLAGVREHDFDQGLRTAGGAPSIGLADRESDVITVPISLEQLGNMGQLHNRPWIDAQCMPKRRQVLFQRLGVAQIAQPLVDAL